MLLSSQWEVSNFHTAQIRNKCIFSQCVAKKPEHEWMEMRQGKWKPPDTLELQMLMSGSTGRENHCDILFVS